MLRLGILAFATLACAFPSGFTFSIANPVASQDFQTKAAAFVFRTEGCADPAKSQITGTAEGMVKGNRQTLTLRLGTTSKPGVFAVYQNWPKEGHWVVNLRGTCAGENAGAVVPIGAKGFIREASKFFPRPATDEEVSTALKALVQGGNK